MDFGVPIPNSLLLCYSLLIPVWLRPLCFKYRHSCFLFFPNICLVILPRGFYCKGLQRLSLPLHHCILSGFVLLPVCWLFEQVSGFSSLFANLMKDFRSTMTVFLLQEVSPLSFLVASTLPRTLQC